MARPGHRVNPRQGDHGGQGKLGGVSPPPQIRVIVGEDQPFVREGIVHVLRDAGFDVVVDGAAADARDLVLMARVNSPDVVIADIQMPPDHADDGLRAALQIRAA